MAFGLASGHPTYSGGFLPDIWSGKLQVKFYKSSVFTDISNTDHESEIKKFGDEVIIRVIPDITINTYTAGAELTDEIPDDSTVSLLIDKGKYFSVIVDDVMKVQSDLDLLDMFTDDAAEQMKISIDSDVLNNVYSDASSDNIGTTAGVISGSYNLGTTNFMVQVDRTTAIDYLMDANSVLDEQNVPETGRWAVLPNWYCNLLKKSDLKDASLMGDSISVARNGKLGRIDNLTLYKSNNYTAVPDTGHSCYHVLIGHPSAITFASQIVKMETLRSEKTFGTKVRGLNVYGYKVVKPEALTDFYCYK